jgi:hypothetical protein
VPTGGKEAAGEELSSWLDSPGRMILALVLIGGAVAMALAA